MTEAERHELAEAEALAQALERDAALPDLPADALQTAAFLRFNTKDAELGDAAEQRIFTELQGTFERTPQPRSPSWFSPRRLLLWLTPALALGALSLIVVRQQHPTQSEATLAAPRVTTHASPVLSQRLLTVTTLPKPSARLSAALAERLQWTPRGPNDYVSVKSKLWTHELNQYRSELVQTLDPQHAKATLEAHKLAQAATNDEQRQSAATALGRLAESLKKVGTPSSTLLAQDALCEFALLFLDMGRYLEGLARAEQGIELSEAPSIFLANLYLTRAEAYQLLERHDEAPAALFEALNVNQHLMQRSLGK
jgi:tetratricopeptide (TPR) repeat protein